MCVWIYCVQNIELDSAGNLVKQKEIQFFFFK